LLDEDVPGRRSATFPALLSDSSILAKSGCAISNLRKSAFEIIATNQPEHALHAATPNRMGNGPQPELGPKCSIARGSLVEELI
jgi:hypothetical protein